MTTALTTVEKSRDMAAYFEGAKDKFASFMEEGEVGKFMRVLNNAILRDPEIATASKQSVFLECQKAAADGLVLDGREAVLTRFKSNKRIQQGGKWVDNWQTEVVYIPMIKGLRKLVLQSPQVASWNTGLVYEKEYDEGRFDYTAEPPMLLHKPIIVGDRGPVVAAYSVVRLRNGQVSIMVMTRGALDRIKGRTKSKKPAKGNEPEKITGPWATDEEEMFIKTVARRHFKSLPLGGKIDDAVTRVDGLYDYDQETGEIADDAPPVPVAKAVANKKKTSAKEKLEAARPKPGPDPDGDPAGDGTGTTIEHEEAEIDEGEEKEPIEGEILPEDEF